jgi:hypothetical protein
LLLSGRFYGKAGNWSLAHGVVRAGNIDSYTADIQAILIVMEILNGFKSGIFILLRFVRIP